MCLDTTVLASAAHFAKRLFTLWSSNTPNPLETKLKTIINLEMSLQSDPSSDSLDKVFLTFEGKIRSFVIVIFVKIMECLACLFADVENEWKGFCPFRDCVKDSITSAVYLPHLAQTECVS